MSLRPLSSEKFKAWWPGAITAGLWAAAAASMFYWGVQLTVPQTRPVLTLPEVAAESRGDSAAFMAHALGHATSVRVSPVSNPFKLLGVLASASGQGSALISVDGLPPRPYRVGQTVHEGWTLLSLTSKQAKLQSSGTELVLDLPVIETR